MRPERQPNRAYLRPLVKTSLPLRIVILIVIVILILILISFPFRIQHLRIPVLFSAFQISGFELSGFSPHTSTVTSKNVAGIDVASLFALLFSRWNSVSNSFCNSAARPFFSAASNAFIVGP